MKELLIHESHYNLEPVLDNVNRIAGTEIARRFNIWLTLAASCFALFLAIGMRINGSAQGAATDTPAPNTNQAYITNTFEGEPAINVRTGPSTIIYPAPCGSLAFGASAPALGASPGHDWIQIAYASCPGGVGWIYAANVTLTGALRIVEPPPTPTSPATATFDPTLEAAFQVQPTETRLPTFTPPPPLAVPTYIGADRPRGDFPTGMLILALAITGGVVLAGSFIGRR